jgi:hypothetical protein
MTVDTHDRRRCRAHNRAGEPCGLSPIRGGMVCQVHGGRAPQVKMAAAERIAEMVDPALNALRKLVDEADQDSVRLSAIKDILDRAGYKPREKIDLNVQTMKTLDQQAWESV